jgi:hypothetical protein
VHDPFVAAAEIRRAGATPASWGQLLARSRDLVLAAALTEHTRGLLDGPALARLRDGATVVNVARGGLVDRRAHARGPRGALPRADVTDPEERCRRASSAGRVARSSPPRRRRPARGPPAIATIVLDDLERFFRGRPVRNRVTPSMLRRMT